MKCMEGGGGHAAHGHPASGHLPAAAGRHQEDWSLAVERPRGSTASSRRWTGLRQRRASLLLLLLCLAVFMGGVVKESLQMSQLLPHTTRQPAALSILAGCNKTLMMDSDSLKLASLVNDNNTRRVEAELLEGHLMKVAGVLSQLPTARKGALLQRFLSSVSDHIPATTTGEPATHQVRVMARLPVTVVPPTAWVTYRSRWRGLPLPVLTCKPLGRLGNVLGEYATLYAIRRLYNTSVVVLPDMKKTFNDIFPNTSLPDLPGVYRAREWRTVANLGSLYNYAPVEVAAAGLLGPHLFVMSEYAFEIQLFNQFKEDIRREFTLAPTYTATVQSFLSTVTHQRRARGLPDPVFVGFHIRRTDYARHAKNLFGAKLPEAPYFRRALEYYRRRFPGRVVFIAASDDRRYITSQLSQYEDVFFSPGTSAMLDLAVLSSCNHSIITLGSYGFWSAFLTGGEVVYPDVHCTKEYRFSRGMYEKVGLKNFTPLPVD